MAVHSKWQPTRAGLLLTLGIVLLAGLVFVGLWAVKDRADTARRDEAIRIAADQLESESDGVVALNEGNESSDESTAPSSSESEGAGASGSTSTREDASATELPQTGADGLWQFMVALAVALFAYSGIYILRNKRQSNT